MKKHILHLFIILTLLFRAGQAFSQTAPPPPDSHGATTDQAANGGGAPIGGGLFILLGLGIAYGGKKLYDRRKEPLEE